MNRLASLQKRAADTCRALFRAQPYGVRLACVYVMLKTGATMPSSLSKIVNHGLGAVFILKGVRGLSDIHGKSPEEWLAALPENKRTPWGIMGLRGPDALPDNYLGVAASWIWGKATKDLGPHAQSAVAAWVPRFTDQGWRTMREGITLKEACAYVNTGIKNTAKNQFETERNQKVDFSFDEADEEGNVLHTPVTEMNALQDLLDKTPALTPRVRHLLDTQVHPDASRFLDLLMEGHLKKHILLGEPGGDGSMLPHEKAKPKPMSETGWQKKIPKMLDILEREGVVDPRTVEHVRNLHSPSGYKQHEREKRRSP